MNAVSKIPVNRVPYKTLEQRVSDQVDELIRKLEQKTPLPNRLKIFLMEHKRQVVTPFRKRIRRVAGRDEQMIYACLQVVSEAIPAVVSDLRRQRRENGRKAVLHLRLGKWLRKIDSIQKA